MVGLKEIKCRKGGKKAYNDFYGRNKHKVDKGQSKAGDILYLYVLMCTLECMAYDNSGYVAAYSCFWYYENY